MSHNKHSVVFDGCLLISATFKKKQDVFYNVTRSINPTTEVYSKYTHIETERCTFSFTWH